MSAEAALLAALPEWAFGFALVLTRVAVVVMLMPGVGDLQLPQTVRAGLVLALTLLLLPGLKDAIPAEPAHPLALAVMVGAEILAGGTLGWLARLAVMALPMAGHFVSHMLGLSNVLQPDAELGAQSSMLQHAFGVAAVVVVMTSGLYALPLLALSGSYGVFPPGGAGFAADSAATMVQAVGISFALALQLAAPFVLVGVVWQVVLGLLGRLVPRLQVYFVTMPGQLLGGLLLLGALVPVMIEAWRAALRETWSQLPGIG